MLTGFEEAETAEPSACKVYGDRIIFASCKLRVRGSAGGPVLCDFGVARSGEARSGEGEFTADIQPYLYRAPEVVLDIPWREKVDIWNLGVLVSSFVTVTN